MNQGKKKDSAPVKQSPIITTDTSAVDEILQEDNSTSDDVSSTSHEQQDRLKGRHFTYVVYPESAPEDWIEQLRQTGLTFVVSPLHDKDINADGTPKKPHWHIIISWANSTTYKAARGLCDTILHCPLPKILKNPTGMYRYFNHKDNPEKYQYTATPKAYNGWTRPLDSTEVSTIINEIRRMMYILDCQEYAELVSECVQEGPEYFDVVTNHTFLFEKLCTSYRHAPIRTLMRFYNELDKDDTEIRKTIEQRISYYEKED